MLSIYDKAEIRAKQSDNPPRFMGQFMGTLASIAHGDDVEHWRRDLSDPIVVAAQIEALAAARIHASQGHSARCVCLPCRVRRNDEFLDAIRQEVHA
ncbi:hypothetical protein [Streptomyces sp. NPDC046821]|uniref:hypothetical protein n=1 Tax=Streptomyces sp. NPDC046821 TaxID=3154702 RepID=UPI00340FA004